MLIQLVRGRPALIWALLPLSTALLIGGLFLLAWSA
jgi:hypothetical protein